MWSSRLCTTASLLLTFLLTCAQCQDKNGDFKHELPEGVELVDPKSLGLTDTDLSKFLGNVKVLGGGQVGDTKTQILTVGFDGNENINFNDFHIPGLTDGNNTALPEKDKEIADVAFKKFKEFFQDPKNAKHYDDTKNFDVPFSNNAEPPKHRHIPQKHGQHFQQNPPQYHIPMIQKPYTTPRPQFQNGPRHPQQVYQHQHQAPPRQVHQAPRPQQQHHDIHSRPPIQQLPIRPNHVTRPPPPPPPQRQYVTPYIQAQNQQQHQPQIQHSQIKSQASNLEFGARIPVSPNQQQHNQPQPTQQQQQQYQQQTQGQYHFHRQHQQQNQHRLTIQHQHKNIQHDTHLQPPPPPQQPVATSPPPQQNFQKHSQPTQHQQVQNFNSHIQQNHQKPQEPVGRVVRNQLLSVNNNPARNPESSKQQAPHQQYHTTTNHIPAHSHQQTAIQPPPANIPNTATSHVFIQRGPQSNTIRHTPFHPGFQPPTRFAKDFTPLPPQATTQRPHFEVTPSMPLIPLSTNENAIKDPMRTLQLRQFQRERVSPSNTQHSQFVLPTQVAPTTPTTTPISITTSYPEVETNHPGFTSQSFNSENQLNLNRQNAPLSENEIFNKNRFSLQSQQQQHQLHLLQRQQHQQSQHAQYQQNQPQQTKQVQTQPGFYQHEHNRPQKQGSSPNFQFHVQHELGRPPRFQMNPSPSNLLNTIRRKRGYRRLSNLFRMFRWDRNRQQLHQHQ